MHKNSFSFAITLAALAIFAACSTQKTSHSLASTTLREAQGSTKEEVLFSDEFSKHFDAGIGKETWLYASYPSYIANDAITTFTNGIMHVRSSGTNNKNEPSFTLTVPQNTKPGQVPGTADHLKWVVATNHLNSATKIPGFATKDGKELVCEANIRGQIFNTASHPFGAAAAPNDPRLGMVAITAFDGETYIEFDFLLTNDKIYALYERQPEGRGKDLGNYAAFTYIKEVANREPSTYHELAIAYDRRQKTARWLINGKEVYSVNTIGQLLGSENLALNFGGDEPKESITLNQLNCGMAHFTLLDAFLPTQKALVRLSGLPNFYHHPLTNKELRFVDEKSSPKSRLFGQGVSMDVKSYKVKYLSSR